MEENKMGVMPIGKLIVTMSLPIMISMLVQALYNVVDSVFVARIDEYALTAVSMAFPIQNLMIPDRYRRNRAVRPTVYFHLLLSVFWCLYPDYV